CQRAPEISEPAFQNLRFVCIHQETDERRSSHLRTHFEREHSPSRLVCRLRAEVATARSNKCDEDKCKVSGSGLSGIHLLVLSPYSRSERRRTFPNIHDIWLPLFQMLRLRMKRLPHWNWLSRGFGCPNARP